MCICNCARAYCIRHICPSVLQKREGTEIRYVILLRMQALNSRCKWGSGNPFPIRTSHLPTERKETFVQLWVLLMSCHWCPSSFGIRLLGRLRMTTQYVSPSTVPHIFFHFQAMSQNRVWIQLIDATLLRTSTDAVMARPRQFLLLFLAGMQLMTGKSVGECAFTEQH